MEHGAGMRFLQRVCRVWWFQVEYKWKSSCAAVSAGWLYGDWTGGMVKERECRKLVDASTSEYETKLQLYEARAREVGMLEADAN
ncbi:unnamed protein product [Microthlaspi erraticum]|uniref:Uncharacterized protein n=1 Tax=Microthlaspi erraticum TaxID=1685480 RepID=A0A6D2HQ74_9BRAS|nr:unnamed protein product [Microthlaspi erraticum]